MGRFSEEIHFGSHHHGDDNSWIAIPAFDVQQGLQAKPLPKGKGRGFPVVAQPSPPCASKRPAEGSAGSRACCRTTDMVVRKPRSGVNLDRGIVLALLRRRHDCPPYLTNDSATMELFGLPSQAPCGAIFLHSSHGACQLKFLARGVCLN